MNNGSLIVWLVLIVILVVRRRNKTMWFARHIHSKKTEGHIIMLEMAKQFINKECIIYTLTSQMTGVIKEVSNGAVLLDDGKTSEAVNLDFVIRIREYPRKKNGKKKAIVID